jgi:hypothetical protein
VAQAFERVHVKHKDTIIACFKSVRLSLSVDGTEDHLLKVRDCPNLDFGNWQKALKGTIENPTIIDDDSGDTIEVDDNNQGLLYTAQEVEEGIMIKEEDESEVTSDSGVDLDERFDPDSESDFNDDVDGDENVDDENM